MGTHRVVGIKIIKQLYDVAEGKSIKFRNITTPLYLFFVAILFFSKSIARQSGEKKGWPSVERHAFITECVATAKVNLSEDSARFYCYCMQEKVEKKYPTIEEASKISGNDMQSPEWQRDIKSCLAGPWGL